MKSKEQGARQNLISSDGNRCFTDFIVNAIDMGSK